MFELDGLFTIPRFASQPARAAEDDNEQACQSAQRETVKLSRRFKSLRHSPPGRENE